MFKKRGQISFEYLTIVSFGLAVLLVAIYLFYSYSVNSNDDFIVSRIENTGQDIIHNAETLYYVTGQDSSTHLEFSIPSNVKNIYIYNGTTDVNELTIEYTTSRGTSETVFFSNVDIYGGYKINDNKTTFFKDANQRTGAIKIKFTNTQDGVKIEEVS
jgi:uncharacterized protein (UPF0333 family)